jgi:hypothetical protein
MVLLYFSCTVIIDLYINGRMQIIFQKIKNICDVDLPLLRRAATCSTFCPFGPQFDLSSSWASLIIRGASPSAKKIA